MNAPTDYDPALRRFTLGDGLILLGALAITLERFRSMDWFRSVPKSLAWCWQATSQLAGWSPWHRFIGYTRRQLGIEVTAQVVDLLLRTLCPVLLGLMLAQPLVRLRRPRPALAHVVRQSGFVTCVIGIVTLGMLVLLDELWFSDVTLTFGLTRGMILLMAWPMLGLPPWQAERSWVDRLGRAVGWGWIVAVADAAVLECMGRI